MKKDEFKLTHSEEIAKSRTLILCDFDGTVSTKDTVNRLMQSHVISDDWLQYVKQYLRGELGSKGVYEGVAPLMRMLPEDLERFVLEHSALDPAFPTFLEWAAGKGIDVKIVSDGFDATIETLFRNHGIEGLDIYANGLILGENGSVTMTSPYADPKCGRCGTCKLEILRSLRSEYNRIILVGDGTSDRHAATEADAVLALKDLFIYCAREGIPAVRIDGFHEIPDLLERRIRLVIFDMDGTLIDSTSSIAESFNYMFSRLGYPTMTVEQVVRETSVSLRDFVDGYLKPEEAEDAIRIFREHYSKIYLSRSSMIPGAADTLHALDGDFFRGVVTNKKGDYARKLARHFGFLDSMIRIIGAHDGFETKPAGEMFQEFMRVVETGPDSTIYVGDGLIDIEAAKSAGIDAFAVEGPIFSAQELAEHGPRRVLKRITDLPDALKPLV